ncbi:MAG: LysE family translocator [Acidimicrobiia bacterium]|nr:LysE family translocator [Acidimicrobiia bacterium]NNC92110.1 LysE family translocator [Acidimicrobiia bacterium]
MAELFAGISLGFAAGVSPGPLLTLVVVTALEHGPAAAIRVSFAPLVTDTTVIVLAVAVLTTVPDSVFTALGITGGGYLIVLGLQEVTSSPVADTPADRGVSVDLLRGIGVNFLSPHPWLFWITAGGPLLVEAWRRAPARGVAFLGGFYVLIVGTKAVIGWVIGRSRHRLSPRLRHRLVRLGGILLIAVGATLILRQL